MDERYKTTCLFDIYKALLTEKQKNVLEMYLDEDYTLTEISQNENVSRQAAFDLIKRTEKLLYDYDEKLGLYEKYSENRKTIDELRALTAQNKAASMLLDKLENSI